MEPKVRNLSLYVHIPFCKRKCIYCDFLSFGGCSEMEQSEYIKALCKEIAAYQSIAKEYIIKTIFIGGGTPSYINPNWIAQILNQIKEVFVVDSNAEITMEGNPDSLTEEHLAVYKNAGINRLSIGLQSTNDSMLKTLNRVHDYEQFLVAFKTARKMGFSNINIDLMSGLPGENIDSYRDTVLKVLELKPEHISAYSLIVEEGTALQERTDLLDLLPKEEEDREQYAITKELLQKEGYVRYEISNYAKKGYECRHNIVYWTGGEYLGLGLGAASYMKVVLENGKQETIRFHGMENMQEYSSRFLNCTGIKEDEYTNMYHYFEEDELDLDTQLYEAYGMNAEYDDSANLSKYKDYEDNAFLEFLRDYYKDLYFSKKKDEMEEFMFLGLRMIRGISKQEFKERFGVLIETVYDKVIKRYIERGLLCEENGYIFLSDKGIDVSNVVMAEFML